jgi:crotonobetainyl-CoA:carnitine CoA-transferase CaiB-like acyl-CoA transferase
MVIEIEDPVIGSMKLVGDPMRFSRMEARTDIPSPTLGENTDEVLLAAGYTQEQIAEFRRAGAVA